MKLSHLLLSAALALCLCLPKCTCKKDDLLVPGSGTLQIISISPTTGDAGTIVTITGTGFDTIATGNIVKIDGITVTITSSTATSIVFTIPSAAASGAVTVTVAGKTVTGPSFSVVGTPTIYAAGSADSLFAIDAATGHIKWSAYISGIVDEPVLVDNGIIFVNTDSSVAYSFNASTGQQIWRNNYLAGSEVSFSGLYAPVVAAGVECVMRFPFTFAFDSATGNMLWNTMNWTDSGFIGGPIASGGLFIMPFDASNPLLYNYNPAELCGIDPASGNKQWTLPFGNILKINFSASAPLIYHGNMYIGGDSLYAFDLSDGDRLWQQNIGYTNGLQTGTGVGNPVAAGGIVYMLNSADTLFAFDATTGNLDWTYTANFAGGTPVVANGVIYASIGATPFGGGVIALNAATGSLMWSSTNVPGLSYSDGPLAYNNGLVFISTVGATMIALNATNGAQVWAIGESGGRFTSPVVY